VFAQAALVLCLAAGGCGQDGPASGKAVISAAPTLIRCVNTVSGAGWTLALDGARGVADGRPARFGPRWVNWNDAAGSSTFALDRNSGALTVTRGSSTGGWVATFACRA